MKTEAKDDGRLHVVGVDDDVVVGALDNSERHLFLLADCCIGMIELY